VFFSKQRFLVGLSSALGGACIVLAITGVRGTLRSNSATLALTGVAVLAVQQFGRSRDRKLTLAVCSTGSRAITPRLRERRPTR